MLVKSALLLLTPRCFEVGNFAQGEKLPMLLEEHQKPGGLKLLQVLVENCAYTEHPGMASLQLGLTANARASSGAPTCAR